MIPRTTILNHQFFSSKINSTNCFHQFLSMASISLMVVSILLESFMILAIRQRQAARCLIISGWDHGFAHVSRLDITPWWGSHQLHQVASKGDITIAESYSWTNPVSNHGFMLPVTCGHIQVLGCEIWWAQWDSGRPTLTSAYVWCQELWLTCGWFVNSGLTEPTWMVVY